MHYKFSLSEEAENDILESYVWYEQQRAGLGEEFLKSLDKALISISKNPESYRIRFKKK
jgi:toxin ParE1/3/4